MANILKPKRSATAAKVPTTTDLASGELGVNMADRKVYINNGTSVVQVGAGTLVALEDTTITSPTSGQTLSYNGTKWVNSTGGTGTVTSVGGVGTVSGLTLTGTVTAAGSLTLGGTLAVTPSNFASQTANTVLAAPNGSAGAPTFRILAEADIPALTLEKLPDAAFKRSVRAATTANLAATATTTTLTASTLVALPAQDGITLAVNDRVLVKDQTATAQNGIYRVTNLGVAGTTAWVLTRVADADTASEIAGAMVNVDSGTVNGGRLFDTDFKSTDTLGTTGIVFGRVVDTGYFTTVGNSFATLTNPSAITFPQINANNTVSALTAANFRTAIGAGTSSTTGTVTSVATGTGLSGGTITTSGTISLANTTVTAGSYTNASITVDAQGRITAASSGAAAGATNITITAGTTAGPTINSSTGTGAVIPSASDTASGVITTGAQTIAGVKTFATDTGFGSGTGIRFLNVDSASTKAIRFTNSANSAYVFTFGDTGDFVASGNVTAYSDERLKTNWRNLPTDFIERLSHVKAGVYDRTDTEATQVGVSAQSLQSVMPNAIVEGADGLLAVSYGNAALAASVELARDNVELRARVAKLEALVSKLIEG